jgi:PAS domain S-box-containing protein
VLEKWGYAIFVALLAAAGVALVPVLLRSRWQRSWAIGVAGVSLLCIAAALAAIEASPERYLLTHGMLVAIHLFLSIVLVGVLLYLVLLLNEARRGESRLREVVERQPDLVCRFKPDTTLTFVNPAYAALFGKPVEELQGRQWMDLVPEFEQPALRDHLTQLEAGATPAPYEHRVLLPNGIVRWYRWLDTPVFGANGRIEEFQSVGTDITELKEQELRAVAAVEGLRVLSPLVPVAIISIAADGTCENLNEKWEEMAGESKANLMHRPWIDPVHLDDRERAAQTVAAVLGERAARSAEFRIRTRAGRVTHVTASFSPVPGTVGGGGKVIGAFTDISDRRTREENIRGRSERQALAVAIADTATWESVQNTREFHPDDYFPRMLGYEPGEIPDCIADWLRLIPDADRTQVEKAIAAAVTGATPRFHVEHRMRRKDGRHMWIESVGSVIPNPKDNLVRMAGTCTNITERKQAETERDALARIAAALVDAETPRTIAEALVAETEELFGWDCFLLSQRLPGTDLFQRVLVVDKSGTERIVEHGGDVQPATYGIFPELMAGQAQLINRRKPDEHPLLRMGDVCRPSASLVFAPLCNRGEVFGSFSVQSYTPDFFGERDLRLAKAVADLAAPALRRAHVEEALRLNQRKLEALLGSSAVAAARTDLRGVVTAANDAFLEVIGRTRDETIGTAVRDFTHPEDWAVEQPTVREVAAGRVDVYRQAKRYLRKDGSAVPVELTAVLIRDDLGRPDSIFGIVSEVAAAGPAGAA